MENSKSASKGKTLKNKKLEVINSHAAGVDIGSRRHYVAIAGDCKEESVRNFGCYTPDLQEYINPRVIGI